jgi:hypothetical protein
VNDRQLIQLALAAGDRLWMLGRKLDAVAPDNTTVLGRMRDAQSGIRARNYEAGTRTMRHDAAFAGSDGMAERHERELVAKVKSARDLINEAWAIVASYPPAHRANATDRRALGLSDGPYCTSCARTAGADGTARREPIRSDLIGPTDVGGRLDAPALLCSWCYGCVRDWGRPPTPAEVERHHSVGRVPWPDDVPRPA